MSLYPRVITEYLAALSIPRGPGSRIFLVDTENGVDTALGDRWTKPLKTLIKAEDKCVADRHDTVLFLARDTADAPAASIVWDKDHTHLVGLSGNLAGIGQRCRVEATPAADLNPVVTFSGKGSIVRNMQFMNLADADVDSGCVIVSGGRCEFTNVMIAGMGHTTPGARAGAYSLDLSGEECLFTDCQIGLDTILRAAANSELIVSGGARQTFRHCRFVSHSSTAGKFLVNIANMDRWIEFDNCLFYNFSTNWAQMLDNAFNIDEIATHYVILRGLCQLVGITGWADTVTHLYSAAPQSNAGFGVEVSPTT